MLSSPETRGVSKSLEDCFARLGGVQDIIKRMVLVDSIMTEKRLHQGIPCLRRRLIMQSSVKMSTIE